MENRPLPPPPPAPPPPPTMATQAVVNDNNNSNNITSRNISLGGHGMNSAGTANNTTTTTQNKITTFAQQPPPPPPPPRMPLPRPTINVQRVVSSQFENEAETHILAALEQSSRRLVGEGIEAVGVTSAGIGGMEDYSDDDDDDDDNHHPRGLSEDTFLQKLTSIQNELPQYQQRLSIDNNDDGDYHSSSSPSSKTSATRTYTEMRGDGDDDDGIGGFDKSTTTNAQSVLAMHIQQEISGGGGGGGGDDIFVEATKQSVVTGGTEHDAIVAGGDMGDGDGGNNVDVSQTDTQTSPSEKKKKNKTETTTTTTTERNIMTSGTENTDTMNHMADQLRLLQGTRRPSLVRGSGTFRGGSSIRSTTSSSGDGKPESAGDKLIAALNRADYSSKDIKFWQEIEELIKPKLPEFRNEISKVLLYIAVPCLMVAALLFYMLGNPMASGDLGASISWWIIFVGVRQPIIFECTRIGEVFWVELMALRSRSFNRLVGPYVSLLIIQSSGWPYIIFFWSVLNFIFLYGKLPFHKHWLWWQQQVDLFNSNNAAGIVSESPTYLQILLACIFIGGVVSLKRLLLALYLGRREVTRFGNELETLMAKMILISEVANLARDIETKQHIFKENPIYDQADVNGKLVQFADLMIHNSMSMDGIEGSPSKNNIESFHTNNILDELKTLSSSNVEEQKSDDPGNVGESTGNLPKPMPERASSSGTRSGSAADRPGIMRETSSSANMELINRLTEWEEPEVVNKKKNKASVRDLVIFKKTLKVLDDHYPFSHAFGRAKSREDCVESSQEVFYRLMLSVGSNKVYQSLGDEEDYLPFSIISVLAMDEKGTYVDAKIKSLIRLFRPDREGDLKCLEFVTSIDAVYKELRLLRANIYNSAQIDLAFEKIINLFFYVVVTIVTVSIMGGGERFWSNILALNASFLALSFMFGAAASNYVEGLLLIFVRRPYDIGDRIATSDPSNDTPGDGSSTWFVDSVTLFSTTVRFASTNEVATYSNGSLASLRIINANRSPKASISIAIKLGLDTPFELISVFRKALEMFIQKRPREWISMGAFRAARVEADFGFIEYKILATHREKWQNIGAILQSKADLASFCLEVTKKLGMHFESPPMPVNLSDNIGLRRLLGEGSSDDDNVNVQATNERRDGDPYQRRQQTMSAGALDDVADWFTIRE